jgi:biotin-(acetyl-CoA carboxylase) ligase
MELLFSIIKEFSISFDLFINGSELLVKEWKKACSILGERVKFRSYNNILEGIVTDVSNDGALVVLTNGQRKKIYSTDELILEENLRTIWR